uniref:Sulfotransferase n=1 Tax=Podarcis muralis TaxID=64176 RepID=A0A670K8L2_PODMU
MAQESSRQTCGCLPTATAVLGRKAQGSYTLRAVSFASGTACAHERGICKLQGTSNSPVRSEQAQGQQSTGCLQGGKDKKGGGEGKLGRCIQGNGGDPEDGEATLQHFDAGSTYLILFLFMLHQVMDHKTGWEDMEPIKRTELVEVDGIPCLKDTADNWQRLWAFKARPDDLLICTYPKAGTTWIQEIVSMIQHRGDPQKCDQAPIHQRIPFIDLFPPKPFPHGLDEAEVMPSPRTLKSHLPVPLLPPSFWEQNCKIIYVARNAKDNAVSYFHFHRMNKGMPEPGNWDEFLENFLMGKIAWGSWFDHVRGWWEAKERYQILYLFYEDMKEDPAREIRKVAQFLGLQLPDQVVNQIVQHTMFENMKVNPMTNYSSIPSFIFDQTVSTFMRKGTVGDWKEHFTAAQSEWFDDACLRLLGDSSLVFRTEL